MRIIPTPLEGAATIEIDPLSDERGFFARTFCSDVLRKDGISVRICQCSISFNSASHTLRGLHYQASPHEEEKLVRCTAGAIFDVIVDLRPNSPSYRKWYGAVLSSDNRTTLFVPGGFAHGFITLKPSTEVFYMITKPHMPDFARTIRWDDPTLSIAWPAQPSVISARDASAPILSDLERS